MDIKGNDCLSYKVILLKKAVHCHWHIKPPYCVSRLIQILRGCYRFYIYCKCPKINTFQKDRCTHAWTAIVLLVGFAALSIFHSVKFNDNLFFRGAIVIFCPQGIIAFFHHPYQLNVICVYKPNLLFHCMFAF